VFTGRRQALAANALVRVVSDRHCCGQTTPATFALWWTPSICRDERCGSLSGGLPNGTHRTALLNDLWNSTLLVVSDMVSAALQRVANQTGVYGTAQVVRHECAALVGDGSFAVPSVTSAIWRLGICFLPRTKY